MKFPNARALGIACRRNMLTILDVDSPDERLLADALDEFGRTPFIVRSGSGNFQAWYRHDGEPRSVRPDKSRPIDILGDGFVVAPPSESSKGAYSIIEGSLGDIGSLPTMRRSQATAAALSRPSKLPGVEVGYRNDTLWRDCMKMAPSCRTMDELMVAAVKQNEEAFPTPLSAAEVAGIVGSAWNKEASGDNWFGRRGRVSFDCVEVDELLPSEPDAFILLALLRRNHWGRPTFFAANAMAPGMPGGGWTLKRLAKARRRLVESGLLVLVRSASLHHGAAVYRFKDGQN